MDVQNEWTELDDAVQRREEEIEKAWRKLEADMFADELNDKLPRFAQAERVRAGIAGHEAVLYELIQNWYVPVKDLLQRMAQAQSYRFKDSFRELVIEDKLHHSHGLYWEAEAGAFYGAYYYSIRLVTDENYQPVHFIVECRAEANSLTASPEIEALKEALLQAFKFGPVSGRKREEVAGMEITRFLKKYRQA